MKLDDHQQRLHEIGAADVLTEIERQMGKWGVQAHPTATWITILGEEFGEVCKAGLEAMFKKPGELSRGNQGLTDYRKELIEVAAVALSAVRDFDNRYDPTTGEIK